MGYFSLSHPVIILHFCFLVNISLAQGAVKVYPAPADEAVRAPYTVTVDEQPVDVYAAKSQYFGGDYYFAYFDFSGSVSIKIRSSFSLKELIIQPEHFGVELLRTEVAPKGDTTIHEATLTANRPFRISFEPNGRRKPLLLFGNAMETNVPAPKDPNVVYFAPGVHLPERSP